MRIPGPARRLVAILGAVLVTAALLVGCSSTSSTPSAQALPLPVASYGHAVWAPDGAIYVDMATNAQQANLDARLYRIGTSETRLEAVGPQPEPGCTHSSVTPGFAQRDRLIQLLRTCSMDVGAPSISSESILFNPASGTVSRLAPLGDRLGVRPPSWEPENRRGWTSYNDSNICAGIVEVTPSGFVRLPEPVTIGGRRWELDQIFYEKTCGNNEGEAQMPAVSPDGRQLAFLASPAAVGSSDRNAQPWNLYLRALPNGPPKEIARGFKGPGGSMSFSPDGRLVLFNASGAEWVVDLATGHRRRLVAGNLANVSFSPDGARIVSVVPAKRSDPLGPTEVVIYPIGRLRDF